MMNEEVKHVLKINMNKKYEYFIKRVVDSEKVWSLKDKDGWVTLGIEDKYYFPIWPKKEFADICIGDEWSECYAECISLKDFINEWGYRLEENNIKPTIMWHEGKGIDVDWDRLKEDIKYELKKY